MMLMFLSLRNKIFLFDDKTDEPLWTRHNQLRTSCLWGDPGVKEDILDRRPPNSSETTNRFARANGIDQIIRAHQSGIYGYMPSLHKGKISLIFSSDSYNGDWSKGAVYLIRFAPFKHYNSEQIQDNQSFIQKGNHSIEPLLTYDTILFESEEHLRGTASTSEETQQAANSAQNQV
ncbi:MAG: hypothetical protein EZS28_025087 [Streblomastix strix]|uniref:Serine/threonine specific protein phosphatases domain-containing protein n=1 Tax=Streblomastix strix TaxID=222440 RepID=A0A5J4VA31_9EUKA|nr:MAG: hypothetical protein EZS28_025087 [Streblomastix strix]